MALLIATTLWWAFAWADGPMMVMTAVLFASLFSSHSHANAALKDVLVGSCVGAVLGLSCRFWLLPHVASAWQLALVIAPFLLAGAWLMARPSTAKLAIDLNMTFLLIAQPSLSTDTSIEHSLLQMVAILGGVVTALLTYRWLVPSSPGSEGKRLAVRIANLTLKISNGPSAAMRSRLYGQITVLLVRLITIEKCASTLLLSAFECTAMAQRVAEGRAEKFPLSVADQHGVTHAVATLQNTTIPGADCLESTENTHV
ncbi:FUSC family protein [Pseudomonas baetica]|uniref:FUSC family protein n=1 Tax=Pseudomonas baetica TaxID=674054 RepID=UPI003908042B